MKYIVYQVHTGAGIKVCLDGVEDDAPEDVEEVHTYLREKLSGINPTAIALSGVFTTYELAMDAAKALLASNGADDE